MRHELMDSCAEFEHQLSIIGIQWTANKQSKEITVRRRSRKRRH
jgi:hypothetical protein